MTDGDLVTAVKQLAALERDTRAHAADHPDEKPIAETVMRLAIPARQQIERWIVQRAMRAPVMTT